jgi:hypothetical protein
MTDEADTVPDGPSGGGNKEEEGERMLQAAVGGDVAGLRQVHPHAR